MERNILLVFTSPRKNGNTSVIAQAFCDGAQSRGAVVHRIDIGGKPIRGCLECYACCQDHQGCVQKDSLWDIYANFHLYDAVVFAGPVFFGGLPAQMKAFIDRLFSLYPGGGSKDSALLMTAEGGEETGLGGMSNLEAARLGYQTALHYIQWNIQGIVIATHLKSYEDALRCEARREAYELGRRMGG
ncbi:flavodoxin family protein [Dysosmobacter acutus]|nr:flavodoxin family protein [Dysosmobacter acutus]